ncbi:hypothetical protein LCGC14_1221680, partial [marine sediment metagenome]
MEPLVAGISQCPQCKKIIKQKDREVEIKEENKIKEGNFQDGDYFHKQASLNKKYEIAESGIIISKTESRLFAALICHSAYFQDEKYVRLSWWKNNQHVGMFKIYDKYALNNVIEALKKIDESFDDIWSWSGRFVKKEPKSKEELEIEINKEIIKYRILENRTCPKCQNKMDKMNDMGYLNDINDYGGNWKKQYLLGEYASGVIGLKKMCIIAHMTLTEGMLLIEQNRIEPPIPKKVDDYT